MAGATEKKILYISHANEDAQLAEELRRQLLPFGSKVSVRTRKDIPAGADTRLVIEENIRQASIAIVLVSADIYADDTALNKEIPKIVARARNGALLIVPVLARAVVDWTGLFDIDADLQAVPRNGKFVKSADDRDPAWAEVVTEIRRLLSAQSRPAPGPFNVLFLAASPSDRARLASHKERTEILASVQGTDAGANLRMEEVREVRSRDLQTLFQRHKPQMVHFSGHGDEYGQLVFEDDAGNAQPVSTTALATLFRIVGKSVRCVLLNACYSKAQAEAIGAHVDFVIGMSRAIKDSSAIAFAASFYQALGFKQTVQDAFDLACTEIDMAGLAQGDVPVLLCREGVDPNTVRLIS